ncbi:MAG: helix-turn-helix domain-containing protein [Synechococcaceae cyanobacterium]
MTAPSPPALDPPPALTPPWQGPWRRLSQRLLQRLKRGAQGRAAGGGGPAGGRPEDGLVHAGQRLQQARLRRGLGLRQLADETRISTPVLEALERGWRERLPEAAYLRTMLPLLEEHLALEPGSLREALPVAPPRHRAATRGREGLWRFRPGAIELFNSWQGSVVYGLLMLGLLLALNRHQRLLAQRGLLSVEPVPADAIPVHPAVAAGAASIASASASATASNPGSPRPEVAAQASGQGPVEDLLTAFPELRPLRGAAAGQGLPKLRQERPGSDLSLGQLRLQLAVPTRLNLTSRGGATSIAELRGDLVLPVLPPFQLRLEPTPAAAAVRWNGAPLTPDREGHFRYPPLARP